jgi:hypothetical protein
MPVDDDAREFGKHFKQGGWRLGLLVARNVEPGSPGRPGNRSPENVSDKVSMSKFAELAGVSKSHVSYCFKAWQLAAGEGLCPHAETLSPDDEVLDDIEQDDEHMLEKWPKYLEKAKEPQEPKEPKVPGSRQGSKSGGVKAEKTPQAQLTRVVEQVSDDTERLSEHLGKLLPNVSLGTKADFGKLAQELRGQLDLLERQCDLIHQVLEFIGHGDRDVEDGEHGDAEPEHESQ